MSSRALEPAEPQEGRLDRPSTVSWNPRTPGTTTKRLRLTAMQPTRVDATLWA